MNATLPCATAIEQAIQRISRSTATITTIRSLGGGCIHNARVVHTTAGDYFVKWNDASTFENLEAEAHGLQVLASSGTVRTPQIIDCGNDGDYAFLILEFIGSQTGATIQWEEFGHSLASLHATSWTAYGLDRNNFIGSLPQINTPVPDFPDFFIRRRLEFQLDLAKRSGYIESALQATFERLFTKLPNIFPPERPALLHGDLWSGNVVADAQGRIALIDPAVYYGSRETELAFTRLFGGFSQRFYDAYNEHAPLPPGWRERIDLHNLYPLLVHVNLFGRSYLAQIQGILRRFT